MLVAEGVAGPDRGNTPDTNGGDQVDYRQKLKQIRHTYNDELRKYEEVILYNFLIVIFVRYYLDLAPLPRNKTRHFRCLILKN